MKILIIDNYDSFTYNLVQLVRESGAGQPTIWKNDQVELQAVAAFDKIIFSPGPGLPCEAPIMSEILKSYGNSKSILGVCLGHQAIAIHFGGQLHRLPFVIHGIHRTVKHYSTNCLIFKNIPSTFQVGVYHSWVVSQENFPDCLEITAQSTDQLIMALKHKKLDIQGIQFHPESYLTAVGSQLIKNWIDQ